MKRVFVAKSQREKTTQRALMQYRLPVNYEIVKNALIRAGRKDLIGHDPKALIRPKANPKTASPKTNRHSGLDPESPQPDRKKGKRNNTKPRKKR